MFSHNPGSMANAAITVGGLSIPCGALTTSSNGSLSDDDVRFHLTLSCILRHHLELSSLVHFMYVTTMMQLISHCLN